MMFVLTLISEKYELIRLVTDLLLTLYREGWEPMTPIDTAVDKERALYFVINFKLYTYLATLFESRSIDQLKYDTH